MKITRKQLRRLIESTIREADGMVPGDTASQIAAQDLTSKATSRIQDRDEKDAAKRDAVGDKWGTGAGMADPVLKYTMPRYFWKLFDRASRLGVRTPLRYMGPYGHRPKWFPGFLKAVNQAFFDSDYIFLEKVLNRNHSHNHISVLFLIRLYLPLILYLKYIRRQFDVH